jgi:hypothetical protein
LVVPFSSYLQASWWAAVLQCCSIAHFRGSCLIKLFQSFFFLRLHLRYFFFSAMVYFLGPTLSIRSFLS